VKVLNAKDIAIIDAFPVHDCQKTVLNIGCGEGRIDWHLATKDYRVYATDIQEWPSWAELQKTSIYAEKTLFFSKSDIFDLSSFPIQSSPIVICSQVLEHLSGYKLALVHLLALTEVRLIITIPYRKSFGSPGHRHFWDDKENGEFKDVNEFKRICHPNSVAISKIRTKPKDEGTNIYGYLIIIDKRQNLMGEGIQ